MCIRDSVRSEPIDIIVYAAVATIVFMKSPRNAACIIDVRSKNGRGCAGVQDIGQARGHLRDELQSGEQVGDRIGWSSALG